MKEESLKNEGTKLWEVMKIIIEKVGDQGKEKKKTEKIIETWEPVEKWTLKEKVQNAFE